MWAPPCDSASSRIWWPGAKRTMGGCWCFISRAPDNLDMLVLDSPVIVSDVLEHDVWSHGVQVFLATQGMVLRHFGSSCWNHWVLLESITVWNVVGTVSYIGSVFNIIVCWRLNPSTWQCKIVDFDGPGQWPLWEQKLVFRALCAERSWYFGALMHQAWYLEFWCMVNEAMLWNVLVVEWMMCGRVVVAFRR